MQATTGINGLFAVLVEIPQPGWLGLCASYRITFNFATFEPRRTRTGPGGTFEKRVCVPDEMLRWQRPGTHRSDVFYLHFGNHLDLVIGIRLNDWKERAVGARAVCSTIDKVVWNLFVLLALLEICRLAENEPPHSRHSGKKEPCL